ncbi:MAG: WD40 repeat domain-containing protein [Acidimicrobiia bacterium]|nr:WD40 repeat domain-containing protein [Acidimicrobiia bacterium]
MFGRPRQSQRSQSRLTLRGHRATALVGAAVLLLLPVGCTELERPEAYSPAPDSTLVIGEAESASAEINDTSSAAEEVEDFVPSVEGYVPQILIAAEPQSMRTAGTVASEIPGVIAELSVARMADDLVGGLVVGQVNGPVVYVQGQGEPEILDDVGAQLLDVGYWGGSPRAFLLVGDNVIDWVQLVSEQEAVSRSRQPHLRLAEGEKVESFSAQADLQVIATSDDNCGTLRFYNRTGTDLNLTLPVEPVCTFPGRPSYGSVALSPDGAAVAFTIVEYRADGSEEATELQVWELTGGQALTPRRIGEGLDRITSLTFDGQRIAFLKESADGSSVTVIDLNNNETPIQVPADSIRSVSFARNPVTALQ